MKIVGAIACPAVLDIDEVPRFQPLEFADRGNDVGRCPAPALQVPHQRFIGIGNRLRLEHQRNTVRIGRILECARHAVVGIAVDTVGADLLGKTYHRLPIRYTLGLGAVVPRHRRQEHLHAATMKIGHRLLQPFDAARHGTRQRGLVTVVDADVGIDIPDEHAVDAAVALLQIIQIPVHRVFSGDRVVEISILHHHLRVHEIALRPLRGGQAILLVVVAHADAMLVPPFAQIAQPCRDIFVDVDAPLANVGHRPARRLAGRRQVRADGMRQLIFGDLRDRCALWLAESGGLACGRIRAVHE